MNDKSTFSKNLIKARKIKGWSQEGAAKSIGIKRSVLGSYEESRAEPTHDTLYKICDAYEITDLQSFMSDETYFDVKYSPEIIFTHYSSLPLFKRKAIDILLGLE